jgi:hypothetical protein
MGTLHHASAAIVMPYSIGFVLVEELMFSIGCLKDHAVAYHCKRYVAADAKKALVQRVFAEVDCCHPEEAVRLAMGETVA